MKIVVTGSLGNISKPLTENLVQKGHSVTVISSKEDKQKDIEALGAKAAIGTLLDVDFLTETFRGTDIVYVMEPGDVGDFFDPNLDFVASKTAIGTTYKKAIEQSGVKRVVHLSSNGAHTNKDNGILVIHYNVENILRQLPEDVTIKFIRAASFFQNVLHYTQTIKAQNSIFSNYEGTEPEPWVSTSDIADVIAEEMEKPFEKREIRYVASEELTAIQVAQMLANALGKPKIDWVVISDEQLLESMVSIGMKPASAKLYVEMTAWRRGGKMFEDYFKNRPKVFGKRRLNDFIKDVFVPAYNTS